MLVAIALIAYIRARINIHRFKTRYRDKWLLVAGSRHGWYDFMQNNVAPALPSGMELILGSRNNFPVLNVLRWLKVKGAKPLLIYVTISREVKYISLHKELLPMRPRAARDLTIQREVSAVIAAAQAQLTELA